MSKADYALGWQEGHVAGEQVAATKIADVLEARLPELFYEWANDMGSEIVEIIRLKSGEDNG
jgi:hypothetical protein